MGVRPPRKRISTSTKNLLKRPLLADFSFKTPRIRCSKLVRWSLSYSRPNPWGSNPVLSRLKINDHEDRRKTFCETWTIDMTCYSYRAHLLTQASYDPELHFGKVCARSVGNEGRLSRFHILANFKRLKTGLEPHGFGRE